MTLLKANILANYGGQLAMSLVGYVAVPFYMFYLGKEGYGMVGFFLTLQATLAVLDFGLSTTANREISRLSGTADSRAQARDLLRTLELFYGAVGGGIFVVVALGAGFVAQNWIKSSMISSEEIHRCIVIAGATIGLRWPIALYAGVLRGQERQVALNVTSSALSVGRALSGVLVLMFLAHSALAFYVVQLVCGVIETAIMSVTAWWGMGGFRGGASFSRRILGRVWQFSLRLAGISFCAMLLKQVDRLTISALLPLEQLGFYTNAVLVGMGLAKIFGPMQIAVFPRLTRLIARGDHAELARTFHRSAHTMAFVVSPAAALLLFYSRDVLHLWLRAGDPTGEAAAAAAVPLAVTAAAMLFNAAMAVPYSLQIAAGMTWLPLCTNAIGAALLVPLSFGLVKLWGLSGAAYAWLAFNVLYYLIVPQVLFRHVLQGSKLRWYLRDTLPSMGLAVLTVGLGRLAGSHLPGLLAQCGFILGALALYTVASWITSETIRSIAVGFPLVSPLLARCGPRSIALEGCSKTH